MIVLSVNINKIATLRNSRGGDVPNLIKFATDVQNYGAQGITIHPRPDERHIRYQDARDLKPFVHTEYNIEGVNDPYIYLNINLLKRYLIDDIKICDQYKIDDKTIIKIN